ncbi:MAG: patatin family protein [Treponema sp.]|nr:patatin family protein [Treponema sp.]
MIKAALVLEGGSLRTLFTAGVLDVFIENEIEFECIVGVSAGAFNGANYIAKHIERTAKINILHSNDPNYFGIRQLLFKRSAFNFNYIFNSPINDLYPYDKNRLTVSKTNFFVCATDCETGKAVYFQKNNFHELSLALQASGSMPLFSKPVIVDGITCLDGAISEPVGINKAVAEGYEKIIVVLTRDLKSKKEVGKITRFLYKAFYKKYPLLLETLNNSADDYNALIETINKLEREKKIFVIRPSREVKISKMEKDARKLTDLYFRGKDDARELMEAMFEYLKS